MKHGVRIGRTMEVLELPPLMLRLQPHAHGLGTVGDCCRMLRAAIRAGPAHALLLRRPCQTPCSGPTGGDVTTPDMTTLAPVQMWQDPRYVNDTCEWRVTIDGLSQHSDAGGGSAGTITGCTALFVDRNFTDFVLEVDVANADYAHLYASHRVWVDQVARHLGATAAEHERKFAPGASRHKQLISPEVHAFAGRLEEDATADMAVLAERGDGGEVPAPRGRRDLSLRTALAAWRHHLRADGSRHRPSFRNSTGRPDQHVHRAGLAYTYIRV